MKNLLFDKNIRGKKWAAHGQNMGNLWAWATIDRPWHRLKWAWADFVKKEMGIQNYPIPFQSVNIFKIS